MVKIGVVAPWFQALNEVEKDHRVTKREVDTRLRPWQDQVDGSRRKNPFLASLIDLNAGKDPDATATAGAKRSIASILSGAKIDGAYHHSVGVSAVSWSYGSGIPMPNGQALGPAINLTVQLPYIDVKPSYRVRVDEKTRTITVNLEGKSSGEFHPMVAVGPQELRIEAKRPKQLGKEYTIVVRDSSPASATPGAVLAKGTFANMLPM